MSKLNEIEDIFNYAPCGYITTDRNGSITNVNETFTQLTGYKKEELIGKKNFQDLLSIGGKIYYETHYLPLLLHQTIVKEINFEIVSENKARIPVLVNTVMKENKAGELNYMSTVLDITQRKEYEKELFRAKENAEQLALKLKETNKELEEFAYVVSHDIKSPLRTMIGFIQLFEKTYFTLSEEKAFEYLKFVKDSSKSLSSIVDNILNYYTNSNIDDVASESIDVMNLISEVALIADPKSQALLTVRNELDTVNSYEIILKLILLNLYTNALKYNDKEQAKIEIHAFSDFKYHYFKVIDNGRGIEEKHFEKIFKPLKTLGLKDKDGHVGTGLGLSYVKRMVEKLGGTIEVQSEVGKQTTFTFTISKI